jgi:hypothetical protein
VAADQGLAQMFACPVPAAEDLARWRASTELQVAADPDERVGSSGTAAIEAPRPLALSVSEGSSRLPPPRPSLDQAEQLRPEPVGVVPATTGSSALAAAPPHAVPRGKTRSTPPMSGGTALKDVAASGKAVPMIKTPNPRKGPRKAERRAAPDPGVVELRKRPPAELWDMGVEEAFKYAEAKLSGSGTNKKWIKGSQRGFRATAKLASTFFGKDTKLRDISHGDCLNFVEGLALVPDNWGKSPDTRLPMSQLIQGANCPASALMGQFWVIGRRRVSGSS